MTRIVFALLFSLMLCQAAVAEPKVRSEKIYDNVMSPYCPGVTLSACTSPNARELRTQIDSWVDGGLGEQEIKSKLIDIYGKSILGVPTKEGFDLVGWLLPIIMVGGGACGIYLLLRASVGKSGEQEEQQPVKVDSEVQERIEEELRKRAS